MACFFVFLFCLLSSIPSFAQKIHLVYQFDETLLYEKDWLLELLSDFEVEEHRDGHFQTAIDHSIVVVSSGLQVEKFYDYFKSLHDNKINFGVILLSDECYEAPVGFYRFPNFVFRNYWHKQFKDQANVLAFPLGYKQGFWKNKPEIKTTKERQYIWSFAGQVNKSTRQSMYQNMVTIGNHYVFKTPGFTHVNDPNLTSLSTVQYRDLLLNSIFAPAPRGGWNLDSFRVCEALECGCIPIVERSPFDYFAMLFGPYPFLSVNSWEEAPNKIHQLLADPILLEAVRLKCYNWYQEHKTAVKNQMTETIKNAFTEETNL